jgi:putative sigma-54 modulation protein
MEELTLLVEGKELADMGITVSGQNVEVTPALRAYAEKKLKKMERFFEGRPVDVEVVLKVQRELHVADVTIQAGAFLARGQGRTDDMYNSINVAIDRIERQIRKFKTKINRRMRKLGEQVIADVPTGAVEVEEAGEPRVVKTKRFDVKPMSVEEAIMQMELLDHDFFVFRDDASGNVNVVYRRNDGNYGLIEPEAR